MKRICRLAARFLLRRRLTDRQRARLRAADQAAIDRAWFQRKRGSRP